MILAAGYQNKNGAKSLRPKLWKIMKLTIALLLFFTFQVSANGNAQKITIVKDNIYLSEVFKIIEQQTGYHFFYDKNLIQKKKPIDVSIKDATLDQALSACLKDQQLTFSIVKNTIVIRAGKELVSNANSTVSIMEVQLPPPIQIRGIVKDENGNPLPNASITIKGTNKGVTTNATGDFEISVPDRGTVLVISYTGYENKEVTITNQTTITINLVKTDNSLDEVVVIGYGTQKRKDLTGAVSSISSDQFEDVPSTNLSDALAGRLPGLDITSSGYGSGATNQLLMRGQRSLTASNDPLIILDGVPYYGSFDDIDPRNVKSIDILKDAATTSIYGSQGANGVIIITTLRGQEGKTTVSLNGYVGKIIRYGNIPVMDAGQYAEKAREGYRAVGGYPEGVSAKYDSIVFDPIELETISAGGKGLNFQDIVFQDGFQQNYQLGVRGGSKAVTYNISGTYFDQTGIVPYDNYKRLSIRANLDFKFSSIVSAGISLNTGYSENSQRTINKTARTFQGLSDNAITGQGGFLSQVYQADPAGKMYDDDGSPRLRLSSDGLVLNPMTDFLFDSYRFSAKDWRNFGNAYLQIKLIPELTYKLNLGTTFHSNKSGESAGYFSILTNMGNPIANIYNSFSNFKLLENILTYDKKFGVNENHHITTTLVQSFQNFRSEDNYTAVEDYPYEPARFYNLGSANLITAANSDLSLWSQSSFVGRLFYGYNSRYLLTFSIRADGASQFAPGHKWGYFPSAALAWRISEETFLKDKDWIQELKLRASYGVSGNKAIPPYQTQGKLERSSYVFGSDTGFGYTPLTFANQDLTWESTSVLNFGLDFSILHNRISGSIDIYNTNTFDLLLNRKLPITTGFDQILQNVGKTNNKGWELSLQTLNINNTVFKWRSTLTAYSNKTKIVSLFNGHEDDIGSGWFIGHPVNVFYDYKKIGIWQTSDKDNAATFGELPGQIKVLDVNNDGKINGDDRMILGTSEPKLVLSLMNQFNYNNWSLSFLAYARLGGMFYSSGLAPFAKKRYNGIYVDYWTPDNPTNGYPQPNQLYEGPGLYGETLGYRDASYIMLKDITLGYSLPKTLTSRLHISTLNVFISGKNMIYWTESELRRFNMKPDWENGIARTYPALRTIVLGINLDF